MWVGVQRRVRTRDAAWEAISIWGLFKGRSLYEITFCV